MNQLRILLVSLFACALIAVAFLLQTQEAEMAKQSSQPTSAISMADKPELAASDSSAPAREDKGPPAEAPTYSIHGVVLDDLGAPITVPFRVFALRIGGKSHAPVVLFEDSSGRFELPDCEKGTWHIRAAAEGYTQGSDARISHEPNIAHPELRLTLTRRPRIAGIVRTPDGSPITKLKVLWETPTEKPDIRSSMRIRSGDEPGSFSVENARIGEFTIHAEHDHWVASEPQTFTLRPGEERLNLLLILRKGGRIVGMAYDREHSPARQLVIDIDALDLERHAKDLPTQTDDHGRFEASNLSPGFYEVSCWLPSAQDDNPPSADLESPDDEFFALYGTPLAPFVSHLLSNRRTVIVEVTDQRTTHVQLNQPPNAPLQVSGKLTQGDHPLSGYRISFARGDLQIPAFEQAITRVDGSYSVTLDQAGEYLVAVVGTNNKCAGEFMRVIPDGRQHTLNLALASGEIHGNLTARSGHGIDYQQVILTRVDGRFSLQEIYGGASVQTNSEGRFAFQNLPAGNYSLRTQEDIGWRGESSFGGAQPQRITLEPGQIIRDIELKSKSGGSLIGTVQTASGDPIRRVTIVVRDSTGLVIAQSSSILDEVFLIEDIPPGTYQVNARTAQLVSSRPVTISIHASQKTEVSLQLDRGTALEIQTAFAEESWLSVQDGAGRDYANIRGSNDIRNALFTNGFSLNSRTIGPLAPGEYTIVVTTQDGSKRSKTVRLGGEASRVVKLK